MHDCNNTLQSKGAHSRDGVQSSTIEREEKNAQRTKQKIHPIRTTNNQPFVEWSCYTHRWSAITKKMGQKITGWSNNGHRSYTFSKADCGTTSATTIATKNEQLRRVPFYILSTIQQGDGWTKAWLCVRCALNHYFIIFMNWKFTHYANSTMCMILCCGTKSNSRAIGRCQWERKPNSDYLHLHTHTHTYR